MRNVLFCHLAMAVAVVLVGCGGGGGGPSTTTAAPRVSVSWPVRSRDLKAPSSALSVKFVMHRTDQAGSDVTIVADRNASLAAHVETYTSPTVVPTSGTYSLTATFYASAGETGATVGTAAADVKVTSAGALTTPQGQPLGDISFDGTIKTVSVVSGQVVRVGQSISLSASALDASNHVVVVTPGSFSFAVATGQTNLSVTLDGTANGLAEGTATVTASIDGITGAPATVNVIPAAATIRSLGLDASFLVFDPMRNVVYATVPGTNSVVPIDPATATSGAAISVGNSPNCAAVSGDGNHLYVSGDDGTIHRLALPGGTLENTITMPAGVTPIQVIALPNSSDSWVVATQTAGATPGLCYVYDGATQRSSTATMGHWITVDSTGTRLYGYQRFQSSNSHYYTADIGTTGLTNATSAVTDIQGYGNRIHWSSGKIVADNGTIANPDTGVATSHLAFDTIDHVAGVVPNSTRVYYAAWAPYQVKSFDLNQTTQIDSVAVAGATGGFETVTWCGPNRIAFRTFSGSPNKVFIASGLP